MTWTGDKERLEKLAKGIDSSVRLTTKDSWFWKAIALILFLITLGQFKRERFIKSFATTIGPIQAYPSTWPAGSVERVLVHESRHTQQARKFGLGIHPWVGLPFMAIFYLLLPLPVFFAVFRCWMELDASRFSWRHMLKNGAPDHWIRYKADSFAKKVSGAPYAWSLPRSWAVKWFKGEAEKVIAEHKNK
jgi:hypothetical protein